MKDIVIAEAVRSAVGRAHKGSLAQTRADEFAAGDRECLNALPETPARRILASFPEFAVHRAY